MGRALESLTLYCRTMLGISAVMALVIVAEVVLLGAGSNTSLPAANPATASSQDAASETAVARLRIPPVISYQAVVERPLFSDSRRPPAQAAQGGKAAQAAQLGAKWRLTGIVMAGDNSFVHVEGIRDRKTVRLKVGMPLDGWQLEEIEPDHVTFTSGGRSETLQIHQTKP